MARSGQGLWDRLTGGGGAPAAPAPAPAAPAAAPGGIDRPIHAPAYLASSDPFLRLPAGPVRDKAIRFRAQLRDIGDLLQAASQRRHDAVSEKLRARDYFERVSRSPPGGGFRPGSTTRSTYIHGQEPGGHFATTHTSPAGGGQLRDAQRRLADAEAAVATCDAEIAALEARRSRLPERIEGWLRDLPPGVKITARRPARGDAAAEWMSAAKSAPADIEALRSKIVQLREGIAEVRSAPPTTQEVKDKMRIQVAAMSARARPNILEAVELGRDIKFPQLSVQSQVATGIGLGTAYVSQSDTFGFFCWLHGDEIIARLEAEIDELADDEGTMTAEDKAAKEKELHAEILAIEREEEVIIEQLEMSGAAVARREDADIRAVLGLSSDLPV